MKHLKEFKDEENWWKNGGIICCRKRCKKLIHLIWWEEKTFCEKNTRGIARATKNKSDFWHHLSVYVLQMSPQTSWNMQSTLNPIHSTSNVKSLGASWTRDGISLHKKRFSCQSFYINISVSLFWCWPRTWFGMNCGVRWFRSCVLWICHLPVSVAKSCTAICLSGNKGSDYSTAQNVWEGKQEKCKSCGRSKAMDGFRKHAYKTVDIKCFICLPVQKVQFTNTSSRTFLCGVFHCLVQRKGCGWDSSSTRRYPVHDFVSAWKWFFILCTNKIEACFSHLNHSPFRKDSQWQEHDSFFRHSWLLFWAQMLMCDLEQRRGSDSKRVNTMNAGICQNWRLTPVLGLIPKKTLFNPPPILMLTRAQHDLGWIVQGQAVQVLCLLIHVNGSCNFGSGSPPLPWIRLLPGAFYQWKLAGTVEKFLD